LGAYSIPSETGLLIPSDFISHEREYSVVVKHIVSKWVVLVISALTLFGCQYDPWANGYLTTPPSEMDIVGKYAPDAASLKRSIKLPMTGELLAVQPSAAIVLSNDHSAQFNSVPADHDGKEVCSVTGQGSWSIVKNSGRYYSVYVRIHNRESKSPCGTEFNWPLLLYGKRPPYKLHQVIDDPDLGLAVQFEKKK
jgi:hypothetical protein